MKDKFYKTSSHGGCGSTAVFWAVNGKGYVTNLDEAHVYSLEEMQKEASKGYFKYESIPLSVDHVDDLSTWRVDCQYVNKEHEYPSIIDLNDEYVAYKKNKWDGNDLSFGVHLGDSFDYSKAQIISSKMVNLHIGDGVTDWAFVAKSVTDEIARRTFQESDINRRKMIQGAGIFGVRKQRASKSRGMDRWNCPVCGKISWQYNPYDFCGCGDINCTEWRPISERRYNGE